MNDILKPETRLFCLRCGCTWKQRRTHKPKACPVCKSRAWDRAIPPEEARIMNLARKLIGELRRYFKDHKQENV